MGGRGPGDVEKRTSLRVPVRKSAGDSSPGPGKGPVSVRRRGRCWGPQGEAEGFTVDLLKVVGDGGAGASAAGEEGGRTYRGRRGRGRVQRGGAGALMGDERPG